MTLKKLLIILEGIAILAVIFSIILLIIGLIFDLDTHTIHRIETIEIFFGAIFFAEISLQIYLTKNKKNYLKKNWFYILTILPILGTFKIFKAGKLMEIGKTAHIITYSKNVLSKAEKTEKIIFQTKKRSTIAYHLKRADYSKISKTLNLIKVNVYIDPDANKEIVKGAIKGFKESFQKQGYRLILKKKNWYKAFKIENTNQNYENLSPWSFIITTKKLEQKTTMKWSLAIISLAEIKKSPYPHIKKFDYLKGYSLGYHIVSHFFSPCFSDECLHKTTIDEDHAAFMHSIFGKPLLCMHHA